MKTTMPLDEQQEITNFTRAWARRLNLFHEILLEEGVPATIAEGATLGYASNFIQPDYSAFYKKQAEYQAAALERAARAAHEAHEDDE